MKKTMFFLGIALCSVNVRAKTTAATVVQEADGYNAWPMVQTVGDRIVCAYSVGTAHDIGEGVRKVVARTSADGGATWGGAVTVADDPRWGEVAIGKGLDANGAMLLWVRCWHGRSAHHDLYRTTDGAAFEKIATPALDPVPMQITDVIRVPGVGLFCFWFSDGYRAESVRAWGTLTSADNGRTWTQKTVETGLAVDEWPTEPSGVWLGEGKILMVARCEGEKRQFQVTSTDSGKTWTKRKTNITDVFKSTPALVYDAASDLVSNYYYERGAGKLKRRIAVAAEIFGNPASWPPPETLYVGEETNAIDAGNVNVTTNGGRHVATTYTGTSRNTKIVALSVAAPADETVELQGRIDAAWRAGGGRVVVPSGIHRIGGLRLRSNVELHLVSNAVLSASRNCDDYDVLAKDALEPIAPDLLAEARTFKLHVRDRMKPWAGASNPAIRWNNGILRLVGATNVVISGEAGSAIDGNNSYDPEGEEHYRGVHGISAFYSSNVVVRGVELRHTGNWATRFEHCADLTFADLSIRGGHDGVHVRGCDQVRVRRCDIRCGDDAIAGFDNKDVTVEDCSLNTACSAFRFGGTHVRVRRCRIWGPAEWPFRCGLTAEEKRAGVSSQGRGRPNMLSFWTYFADFSQPIRNPPGDIVISDCTVENADRFLHYNFSGNEIWQKGSPLGNIRFERVKASGIGMSLCAYADGKRPLTLELKDCDISFAKPQAEFIRAAHVGGVSLENVSVGGVDGPCVRSWSGVPKMEVRDLKGVRPEVVTATDKFSTESI